MVDTYDVVAVGAGPGGYVAAIRAAQLGLRTALVEPHDLGGLCLNRGCIPSKAMLRSAELLHQLRATDEQASPPLALHYEQVVRRRDRAVAQLRRGLTNLLEGSGLAVIPGQARVRDAETLEILGTSEPALLLFQNLIVATGSSVALPPIPGVELPGVIDSDGALTLARPPQRAVVIGAGAVGVEWADIWQAMGTQVTLLEQLPRIVPGEEPEIARELARLFSRKGIACWADARVQEIRRHDDALDVVATVASQETSAAADVVLLATGRRPNVEGLNLEAAGVHVEPAGIPVDEHMRTNVPHIYAVGDVTGGSLLAHVASHQGLVAAEAIGGNDYLFDDRAIPSVIFTLPEIASVGMKEQDARDRGTAVVTGRFPFAATGRGIAAGESEGFVKVVGDQSSGELLGVHIIGPRAGELISEAALAIRLRASLWDLATTIHPHPTFSEALMEAAWVALGKPIHVPRPRSA